MAEKSIASNIGVLRESVHDTALRCGRDPESIRFILVTKKVPVLKIREAYDCGIRDFGENQVQELLDKVKVLPPDIRWHFIGHLQTNKVKFLLKTPMAQDGRGPLVHSLDRPELAEAMENQAARLGVRTLRCLIQVNCSGEQTKGGFRVEDVPSFVSKLSPKSPICIGGLMTIGPHTKNIEQIRRAFGRVRELQESMRKEFPGRDWSILSTGMSADYTIAIEEGATLLRVGSLVFGSREGR